MRSFRNTCHPCKRSVYAFSFSSTITFGRLLVFTLSSAHGSYPPVSSPTKPPRLSSWIPLSICFLSQQQIPSSSLFRQSYITTLKAQRALHQPGETRCGTYVMHTRRLFLESHSSPGHLRHHHAVERHSGAKAGLVQHYPECYAAHERSHTRFWSVLGKLPCSTWPPQAVMACCRTKHSYMNPISKPPSGAITIPVSYRSKRNSASDPLSQ